MIYATPSTQSSQLKSEVLGLNEEAKDEIRDIAAAIAATGELYGKTKDNIIAGLQVIARELSEVPADKVVDAFKAHFRYSPKFPTVSDIAGFIRRGGLPPLERSVYIRLAQKDATDLTDGDREYIRQFEAEAKTPVLKIASEDPFKVSALQEDNARLRSRLAESAKEVERLEVLLTDARKAVIIEKPKPSHAEMVGRTVLQMMSIGAAGDDFLEFLKGEVEKQREQRG